MYLSRVQGCATPRRASDASNCVIPTCSTTFKYVHENGDLLNRRSKNGLSRLHVVHTRGRHNLAKATLVQNAASLSTPSTPASTVIVWFKHDLRIDDHPGLHEALHNGSIIFPVFCFDPKRYDQLVHSPASAAALSKAVTSLRSGIRSLGSDLVVLSGSWDEELPKIAAAVGATVVVAEEEIESVYGRGVESTASVLLSKGVALHTWSTPLYDSYSDQYKEWKKKRSAANPPLDPPSTLPPFPSTLDLSLLQQQTPSADFFLKEAHRSMATSLDPTLVTSLANGANSQETSSSPKTSTLPQDVPRWARSYTEDDLDIALNSASTEPSSAEKIAADTFIDRLPSTLPANGEISFPMGGGQVLGAAAEAAGGDVWESELSSELAAGEGPVMDALNAYLQHVETTADGGGSTWQWRLGSAIAHYDIPAAPDGCFPALFSRALALGVVSRRRIFSEAKALMGKDTDWEPRPGVLNALGWLLSSSGAAGARRRRVRKAAAAAAAVEAGDFHSAMAREREGKRVHGATLRHWRWRGVLTDYLVAHPERPLPGAPAIMLVHGFGAFSEHWRDNVAALAARGFRVYAPTFPGYGRAEKPSMRYGQDLWRDFLADFVYGVVRKPVVVAGNSIGGFISASLAADYPGSVAGLVLVNSAGLLQEGYALPATLPPPPTPPTFIVEGVSRALFSFLEGDVAKQLRRVYPVVPERADDWLASEIARAAGDPGALGVFRSVFYLPRPRALNYLVTDEFGGPTLVLQGGKDPLNDANGRAKELGRLCPNVQVKVLDAGHCPHDEVPGQVNEAMEAFVMRDVMGANERTREVAASGGNGLKIR